MDPFESLAKRKDPFSEISIYMDKIEVVIFIDVSKILESEGRKLLCCPHSILNEMLNFGYKLVKIKIIFFPIQVHGPPKSIHGPHVKSRRCRPKTEV